MSEYYFYNEQNLFYLFSKFLAKINCNFDRNATIKLFSNDPFCDKVLPCKGLAVVKMSKPR